MDYNMKLKLTVLRLCFLTTIVRWTVAHSQPAGAAATTGSAMAGVGIAAQQTPFAVRVDGGQLQGVVDDGVVSYKGIPFAAPPVGDLRWRPPQPPARWRLVCAKRRNLRRIACKDVLARHQRLVRLRRGRRRKIVCT
jgi:hypothetical protein